MADETGRMQVTVRGIPVDYEVRGEGTPVVLIHGWSCDRRYMLDDLEPVFDQRPGWQRIYLDLPGHGKTSAPDWLSTQAQMLQIVQGFISDVVPDGRLAVVGSSYGGYLALGVLRTMRERLLGVALLIPDVPANDGSRNTEQNVTFFEDRSLFTDLAPDEEWIPRALVRHERRMLEAIRSGDMPAHRIADYGFLERLERNYVHTGAAAEPGPPFHGPSLILTGRQDSTVGFRSVGRLLDELPRATYAVIDLAGHQLGRVERPVVFRTLVDDWLDRLELEREGEHQPVP